MGEEYIIGPLEGRIFLQYKDNKLKVFRNTTDITDTFTLASLNIMYYLFKEWKNAEQKLMSLSERMADNES